MDTILKDDDDEILVTKSGIISELNGLRRELAAVKARVDRLYEPPAPGTLPPGFHWDNGRLFCDAEN